MTQRTVEVGLARHAPATGSRIYKVAAMDPGAHLRAGPAGRGAERARGRAGDGDRARVPGAHVRRERSSRAAGELDPATRTMNTEIRVPNADGALIAGMYAQVALTLPSPHRVFELPATAV